MSHSLFILAQAGSGNPLGTFGFVAVLGAIMYFVMIRPQQRQLKDHRALIGGLKKGDDVVTQGGILGKIYAVADKTVTLEIANGVRIRVLKTSITAKGTVAEEVASVATPVEQKEGK